jgi:hypothetical protein
MKVGLVLGAGGAASAAYHAGTLLALEQDLGWDPRPADFRRQHRRHVVTPPPTAHRSAPCAGLAA